MSNIDKQALREAAEKATPGLWVYLPKNTSIEYDYGSDDSQGSITYMDSGDFTQKQTDLNGAFIAAANPATVLALLDELEAAEKRIAELEAREVKLPNPHAHLIWIQAGHAPDDYWDDVAVSHSEKDKCCDGSDRYPVYALWEIKEALSAIGINIAAAGKGE
ncbi:ead/Ea22-like family protein [Enterobacter chengduensis]|uniref:ead/Ea22-like family protein n=1 Tax=Enterobacter chengduensis TaxID=2494701 RepID=UPI0009ED0BE4|nr:ead/Ea22-like family protein [Enterobacter chengduensis]